jgi:hypothetical protein
MNRKVSAPHSQPCHQRSTMTARIHLLLAPLFILATASCERGADVARLPQTKTAPAAAPAPTPPPAPAAAPAPTDPPARYARKCQPVPVRHN